MDSVTYQFYSDEYKGGAISKEEWPAAEREARSTIEKYRRIYTVTPLEENSFSMAVCAVAEVLMQNARADNVQETGVVSSASIGSVSVSYQTPTESERAQNTVHRNKEVYKAASLYLDIYRGVC